MSFNESEVVDQRTDAPVDPATGLPAGRAAPQPRAPILTPVPAADPAPQPRAPPAWSILERAAETKKDLFLYRPDVEAIDPSFRSDPEINRLYRDAPAAYLVTFEIT